MDSEHTSPSIEVVKQVDKFTSQDSISKGSDGWLTTDGSFYKCSSTEHDECADFLVKKNKEQVKDMFWQTDDEYLPSRLKLEGIGFLLIRGNTVPCFDPNLTPIQVDMLNQVNITIVNPATNTECHPSIIQNVITKLKTCVPTIEKYAVLTSEEEEHYPDMPWGNIEKFESSPLTTYLYRNCVFKSPSIDNVFNLISSDHTESIKIKTFWINDLYSRDDYQIRIVPISNAPNLFMYIQEFHHQHDGQSMYRFTDEYQISVRIKSIDDIEEHLRKIDLLYNRTEFEQDIPSPLLTSIFERSQLPKDGY